MEGQFVSAGYGGYVSHAGTVFCAYHDVRIRPPPFASRRMGHPPLSSDFRNTVRGSPDPADGQRAGSRRTGSMGRMAQPGATWRTARRERRKTN